MFDVVNGCVCKVRDKNIDKIVNEYKIPVEKRGEEVRRKKGKQKERKRVSIKRNFERDK